MTLDGQRSLRLFFKFGLLVSLPLAGYLWALMGPSPWTLGVGALCLVMALGAEGLASAAETRLTQLRTIAATEEQAFTAEFANREERIRQMDRVVETLSNQNHDLRGKLVSLHGEVHRLHEEAEQPNPAEPHASGAEAPGQEQTGGEVTDISSFLKR